MLSLDQIDVDMLMEAMADNSFDHTSWLDPATGTIHSSFDPELDGEDAHELADERGWVYIEPFSSSDDYADMEEFIGTLEDHPLAPRLSDAIVGKGAFRRFRDIVHESDLGRPWNHFEAGCRRSRVTKWLGDNGLIDVKAAMMVQLAISASLGRLKPSDDWPAEAPPTPFEAINNSRFQSPIQPASTRPPKLSLVPPVDDDEPKPPPCTVRRAGGPEDLLPLLRLHARERGETEPTEPSEREVWTWTHIQTSALGYVVVAEIDGAIVGTASMTILYNITYDCDPSVLIEAVVVDRAFRRRGVATALIGELLSVSDRHGCNKVQLLSHKRHATDGGHDLYRSLGFEAEAEGFRFYHRGR